MPPYEGNRRRSGIVHARFMFNTRKQEPSESFDDFVSGLRKLSSKCHYDASPPFVQSLLRDRLIVGISNKEIQSKLIQQSDDLSLTSAIEIVRLSSKDLLEKTSIKQENYDEEMPSVHDKLQVQVNVEEGGSKPDVKVSEEAKIAIVIELTNYKAVLMASSGHESEKAKLWEQVYRSAQNIPGASFKSALHLREIFATWKTAAFQARQQSSHEDIKISNSDKLILDLLTGQYNDNFENYTNLTSNFSENCNDELENHDADEYTFNDENHVNSGSDSNGDESCEDTTEDASKVKTATAKRGRGRPRKTSPSHGGSNNSTSMSAEMKVLILKRLFLQKDTITTKGNEKEKKDVWRNLYNSLENKLNIDSPSALRGTFRIWKQRSLKKRDNPIDETITESDKLIFKIFNLDTQTSNKAHDDNDDDNIDNSDVNENEIEEDFNEEVKEEVGEADEQQLKVGFINSKLRLSILYEIAKHRSHILPSSEVSSIDRKEAAWKKVHQKVISDLGLPNLSLQKLKDLAAYWQAKALHASTKNGPVKDLEKLLQFLYKDNKDASSSFPDDLKNGAAPPTLIHGIPSGCIHYSAEAKKSILNKLLQHKDGSGKPIKDHLWEEVLGVAKHYTGNLSITKQKLKYVVKQWKWRAIELFKQGKPAKTDSDKLVFELYDLNDDNAIDCDDDQDVGNQPHYVNEEAKDVVVKLVMLDPMILCRKVDKTSRSSFWSNALEEAKKNDANVSASNAIWLKTAFHQWVKNNESPSEKLAGQIFKCLQEVSRPEHTINSEDYKTCVINEIFQQQNTYLFGSIEERISMWKQILKRVSLKFGKSLSDVQLILQFSSWKEKVKTKLRYGQINQQLTPCERRLLELCSIGNEVYNLPKLAKDSIMSHLQSNSQLLKTGTANHLRQMWVDIHKKTNLTHTIEDHNSFYRSVNRWKLTTLKKQQYLGSLDDNEAMFLSLIGVSPTDWLDVDLLILFEDSNTENVNVKLKIVVPDCAKRRIAEMATMKHDIVYGSNLQDICRFWSETLEAIKTEFDIVCSQPVLLQRAWFSWTFEAWKKRISNVYLLPHEVVLLDLVIVKKSLIAEQFDSEDEAMQDVVDISDSILASILEDILKYKDLMQNDLGLFWTLALKLAQAHWVYCDSPSKLYRAFKLRESRIQQNLMQQIPLTPDKKALLELFGQDMCEDEASDDGDDFIEDEITKIIKEDDDSDSNIKEEIIDEHADLWAATNKSVAAEAAGFVTVPDAIKLVIAKAMLRHRQLIFNDTNQDSGWRKVYRVAQGNGAFYDSIDSMKASINQWKNKALIKLSKDPGAITELDKLMYNIYAIDTGDLDLDLCNSTGTKFSQAILFELPSSRLTTGGKMAILQEILRNKLAIIDNYPTSDAETPPTLISHKARFHAWTNVLQVANAVGGNFPSLAQLTTYVQHQLKIPTLQKIQSRSKINEIDSLVAKIYNELLDTTGLEFLPEYNINSIETQHGCRLCQLQFSRFDELRLHQQVAHGQMAEVDITRKCRVCGYDMGFDKPAIRSHFRTNHTQEAFACDYCDQLFLNDEDYYQHAIGHVAYNPLETLEEVVDGDSEEERNDFAPSSTALKQRKRGVYRKRAKIELPLPLSGDELPKISKKEGGLCPHCGEVSQILSNYCPFC